MFLILRHGETEWNVAGRMQGGLNSPLTARGCAQARQQGALLAAHGLTDLPLYSSPQERAVRTAALALPGRSPHLDPRLGEIGLGAWQGMTLEQIRQRWPAALAGSDPVAWKFAAPGGESLAAMTARIDAFLAAQAGPAIVVTHGVTSQLLRARLLGIAPERIGQLEDRQGVVYRIADGHQDILTRGA